MADPTFAEVVGTNADRLGTRASAAAGIVSDAVAKAEAGVYDAKAATATAAQLLALWVAFLADPFALGRDVVSPGTAGKAKALTVRVPLPGLPATKPSLALEAPLRNGFGVHIPMSAVKLIQLPATETTEFTVEVQPPPAVSGVFRGMVAATWSDGTKKRIEVPIQVP